MSEQQFNDNFELIRDAMKPRPYTTQSLYIKPLNDTTRELYNKKEQDHKQNVARGDSGVDLFVPTDLIIPKGTRGFTIDFQIQCSLNNLIVFDNSEEPLIVDGGTSAYWLLPRSSISNTTLRMSNSVGLIDAGYRGNIMAKVDNIGDFDVHIKQKERLFQIAAPDLRPIHIKVVDTLSETARGEGGFGSTGK